MTFSKAWLLSVKYKLCEFRAFLTSPSQIPVRRNSLDLATTAEKDGTVPHGVDFVAHCSFHPYMTC